MSTANASPAAPSVCSHCSDLGIDAPGTACVLCGKRETDARCNRCLDTGAYETRRSAWSYSDTEMVRCACVKEAA